MKARRRKPWFPFEISHNGLHVGMSLTIEPKPTQKEVLRK
jgi:hypothetical protein